MKLSMKKLTLAGLLILSLGACGQQNESKSSTPKSLLPLSKSLSRQPDKETSASEADDSKKSTKKAGEVTVDQGVSFNGSYYSVQGKSGDIVIANKHYPLAADYNPGEDPTAVAALHELIAAMQAEGYAISDQYSGFRSYETQVDLYQSYVNQDGAAAADRYSARPGYSEHQTGLAFDLIDNSGNLVQEAGASKWLLKNAAKYGFIVRYQEGKEASTGYMPESWHLRYIGEDAKDVAASGKSLEEYFNFTGGDYE
ncbi:MAG: LD-carboxypeptidase LdcB/DacB [Streptococcus sp.]